MNVRFLETFVWVARLKNFRLTAERLHTTQAAISSRIAVLEEDLGVRLFDRGTREVALTRHGAQALAYAERILKLVYEMRQDLSDPQQVAGNVRVGAIESVVHSWLPMFMNRMDETYPNMSIELSSDTTSHLCEQLALGTLDIVFQSTPIVDSGVSNLLLGAFPMSWVASPQLQIAAETLSPMDLATFRILSFARDSAPHQGIVRMFDGLSPEHLSINCITTAAAIIRLAVEGFGIAVLPPAIIQQELLRGDLCLLKVAERFPNLTLVASYRSSPENPLFGTIGRLAQKVVAEFAAISGGDVALLPETLLP